MKRVVVVAVGCLVLGSGCSGADSPGATSSSSTPSASQSPTASPTESPTTSPTESPAPPAGVEVTELAEGPVGLAAVDRTLWAALPRAGTVLGAGDRQTQVGSLPLRLVATPDGLWVSVIGDGSLVRVDPDSGEVDLRVRLKPRTAEPEGLAYADGTLWVVDQAGDRVLALDPASGTVRDEYPTGHEPRLVTAGRSGVFIGDYSGGSVSRVADGRATTRNAGSCLSPQGLAEAAGVVWVACTVDGQVVGLDAKTLKPLVELPDLEYADAVVADGDTVYVVGQQGPTVWTIDAASREVTGELVLGDAPATTENVDAVLVRGSLVVSHPETRRLYDVPLRLLAR